MRIQGNVLRCPLIGFTVLAFYKKTAYSTDVIVRLLSDHKTRYEPIVTVGRGVGCGVSDSVSVTHCVRLSLNLRQNLISALVTCEALSL